MAENKFQADLIKRLRVMFPGCIILKNDANYLQGVPDLLILYRRRWAALECKDSAGATRSRNQIYYVSLMARMSFAAFIYPENKELILNDLQLALGAKRAARVSKPK